MKNVRFCIQYTKILQATGRNLNPSTLNSPSFKSTPIQAAVVSTTNPAPVSTLDNEVGVGNTVNVRSAPTASSTVITPIVQTSSNPTSKLNISPIAPPLPPRRLHKDSGGCLLPNTGFCKTGCSSSQTGSSLPPPPPIPSHGDLSSFHKNESDNVTVPSHPRRPKTDNQLQSASHGVLPLPPNQIATSKDQNDMFLFTIIIFEEKKSVEDKFIGGFKF